MGNPALRGGKGTSKLGRSILCLAIASKDKGMPWRVQGWADENGDRSDKALHPSQVARSHPIHPMGGRSTSKLGGSI
jgi:hypothetical protein